MIIRKLLLTAASIAAICPAVSHASAENTALNACAQAFATSLASGSGVPAFKLQYHSESAGPTITAAVNSRSICKLVTRRPVRRWHAQRVLRIRMAPWSL